MRSFFLSIALIACISTPALAGDPVKVGAVIPLTGTGSIFGQDLRKGMELCSTAKSQILFEDSQGNPPLGLSAFKKLTDLNKIDVGVVAFSGVAGAILPVAAASRIPVILTIVSSRSVTAQTRAEAFRFFTSGEQEAPIMAEYLYSRRHLKTAAVLHLDDEYGLSYRNAFSAQFEKLGGQVVLSQDFARETSDYRTALTRVKASRADVVYFVGHDTHLISAVRQARELGIPAILSTNWILASPNVRKGNESLFENVFLTSPEFYWANGDKQRKFGSSYEVHFGSAPTAYSALGCDVVSLVEYYPSTNLVSSLKSVRNFEGILGKLSASEDGSLEFPLYPAVIRGGAVQPAGAS